MAYLMENKTERKSQNGGHGRVSLTVIVPQDLYLRINDKRARVGRSVVSVGEGLFRQWVDAERELDSIPADLRLLWEACEEPRDPYEEFLRNRIVREVEALKDWRKKESRRAGPP